jgi:hypothetical protein
MNDHNVLGAVFANLGDDQQSIDNRRGVLFICACEYTSLIDSFI